MIKASDIVVEKVKKASIDYLVKTGHDIKEAEVLFDKLMDKLALQLSKNVGGVGTGTAGINPATTTPQSQKVRQLVKGQGSVNAVNSQAPGVDMRGLAVKSATDDELMLCKAAAICTGVKHGLSPLTSLLIFDQQLEKYADDLLKDAQLPTGQLTPSPTDKKMINYLEDMRRTGLRNTQSVAGFNVQDPLSKQRINAIINGLAGVPLTAGTALLEGGRNVANRIRKVQPQ